MRQWKESLGKQKDIQQISEASSLDNGDKLLIISDKAFGLLQVENYMDKWVKTFHIQQKGLPMGRFDGDFTAPAQRETWYLGGGLNKDGIVSSTIVSWFRKLGAVPQVLMLKKPFSHQCSRHQKGFRHV
jgi:hypothetical protein